MKDFKGNEIEVGDTIVYTSDHGGPKLTEGIVESFGNGYMRVARLNTNGWRPIKNGLQEVRVVDKITNEYVTEMRKPINTRIYCVGRCVITKKHVPVAKPGPYSADGVYDPFDGLK